MAIINASAAFTGNSGLATDSSPQWFSGAIWSGSSALVARDFHAQFTFAAFSGAGTWRGVVASQRPNALNIVIGAPIITFPEAYELTPGVVPYDFHRRRGAEEYTDALLQLLPHGPAWPRHDLDSIFVQTVTGLARIWGDVDGRAADLLEHESDPRTALELLPDWERAWGLPDPCFEGSANSIVQRQALLMLKMTFMGGASRQMFQDMAFKLGYRITISEYSPFMCGISWCGQWYQVPK